MERQERLRRELAELESSGLERALRTVTGRLGREVVVDGRRVLNVCSNDYLGLAGADVLADACIAGVQRAGTGVGASRLIIGNHDFHDELERGLAAFHGGEAALLFDSGYQANIGVLGALTGERDAVFSDALNHASIIDGCRLSRARVTVYPHRDTETLADMLGSAGAARRRIVVTDAVFSMDGDRAPARELRALCDEHDAMLIVDEAHAVGCLGRGRGASADAGVAPDVLVGTMGKAFGSFGAYAIASNAARSLLLNRARSFVFTTGLPAGVIAASAAALRVVSGATGDALRRALAERIAQLRAGLQSLSLLVPGAGTTAIFPVMVGTRAAAMTCTRRLLERGIYAQGIRPPTVPRGTSRLRLTVTAAHAEEDVARLLEGLSELVDSALIPKEGYRGTSRP